ncbi:LPXTG cell wall anchor domain-containing protein [Streptomyces sp. APSN-46.1]|uniref:LPXTG cell wall anchor domain-containing protein n=1 Tax=Streptomyces sp. APSN-46.1 TaxID=2929049 RepID=UPI001FB490B2|nr:LPXTG cell wall anchor domain-containing protein [Streptomyces sp. APSN-46.1]MCJ1678978.1 LPXTG cell wall anchor domain-containing protein [Streptomyces sp. APSN-46.1]
MHHSRKRWAAAAVPAVASLLLAAGAAPAFAADSYTVPLHQQVPITADSFGEPGTCTGIPSTQDGWHFIAPGDKKEIAFVKLTVTFEPGGTKEITTFGQPNGNHAYVGSAPGAKLTSAVAEVSGGTLEWFNLSHTCPASVKPSVSAPVTPSKTPSGTPSGSSSGKPSSTPSQSVSPSSSVKPSVSASGTPSVAPSSSATSPAPVSGGTGGGDLAKTGSDLPVGLVSALAAALVGAGALLMVRRRRTQ